MKVDIEHIVDNLTNQVFAIMTNEIKKRIEEDIHSSIGNEKDYSLTQVSTFLKSNQLLHNFFQKEGQNNILLKLYSKFEFIEKNFFINWVYATTQINCLELAVQKHFPDYSILENLNLFLRIKMSSIYKLSAIFGFLHEHKEKLNIDEYNVKQMSLEQIFLSFAKENNKI